MWEPKTNFRYYVDSLSLELIKHFKDMMNDKNSYLEKGFDTPLEGAIYDILIKVRDEQKFEYEAEKCIPLAKAIKKLIDDKSQYIDYLTREDTKSQLSRDLVLLLYSNGYPPQWNQEVFSKILAQVDNQKRNS